MLRSIINSPDYSENFFKWTEKLSMMIRNVDNEKKLITIFGNGGSASDAQHWAAELVCTYKNRNRRPYAALSLTTDTSVLTAWSNDFGFNSVFQRQIQAFQFINGLSIGLSTSGNSPNVIAGLAKAKSLGAKTVLISGSSQGHNPAFDLHVVLPCSDTPIVQSLTQMLYHEVCQQLEY